MNVSVIGTREALARVAAVASPRTLRRRHDGGERVRALVRHFLERDFHRARQRHAQHGASGCGVSTKTRRSKTVTSFKSNPFRYTTGPIKSPTKNDTKLGTTAPAQRCCSDMSGNNTNMRIG